MSYLTLFDALHQETFTQKTFSRINMVKIEKYRNRKIKTHSFSKSTCFKNKTYTQAKCVCNLPLIFVIPSSRVFVLHRTRATLWEIRNGADAVVVLFEN